MYTGVLNGDGKPINHTRHVLVPKREGAELLQRLRYGSGLSSVGILGTSFRSRVTHSDTP
jgi:hypothetical protein